MLIPIQLISRSSQTICLITQTLFLIFLFTSPLLAAPPISSFAERQLVSNILNKRYTATCYERNRDNVHPATPSDCTKAIRQIICGNDAFQMLDFSRSGGPGRIRLPQIYQHGTCHVIVDLVDNTEGIMVKTSLGVIAALAMSVVLQCVISPGYGLEGGYVAAGEGNLIIVSVSGEMELVGSSTPVNQCAAP